jgi:O-acetylhomoserine/O-acetylserine sulfhydrylase-like pyridoxal-dependent enzyme
MRAAQDPWSFQEYLIGSKAEFSISKHGYVAANTGWFSDRSAAYLALGRPVLLQETGYSSFIETGNGLLSFNTPDEALAGIESINSRYEKHCEAARDVAQTYFSHRKILNHLIEHALCKIY